MTTTLAPPPRPVVEAPAAGGAPRRASGVLLALAAGVLVVEVVLQAPGQLVAETRMDLALEPSQFLARAWTPWEGDADMGRVPNQAVGYLFPLGAFHLLGSLLAVPEWLVIRLWIAVVLCVALWGLARLADELRIGDPTSRVVAALAYALSPLVVARVGVTSWFALGAALAPWALIPLIRASRGGPIRARACASALAVVAAGAVNATVTLALVAVPLLFLLTRQGGPRRRRLLAWWGAAVAAGVVWWAGPLLVQARYGFDFLPFTERAAITTAYTSPFEVVRGLGDWISQATLARTPLPAGRDLATSPALVVATGAVAALGVAGLARRDLPSRRFLCTTFAVGVVVLGAGYAGSLGGPFAPAVRDLLDGAASPLRTVVKFQPLVALPLALGVAHALTRVRQAAAGWRGPSARAAVSVAALALVLIGAWPVLAGRLVSDEGFGEVPSWWHDAAEEVAGAPGRVLLVPGLLQGDHTWGFTAQEPFQWLLERPWASRNVAPLGSPGAIEALDTVESALSDGGDPVLADVLALDGFSTVVVRNDGQGRRSLAPDPQSYDLALRRSGLVRIASFGPPLSPSTDPLSPDLDLGQITVYEVPRHGATGLVTSAPTSTATAVAGDASAALVLARFGLADRAWSTDSVALADGALPVAATVLTDTDVRQRTQFGLNRDNTSHVLTATEPGADPVESVLLGPDGAPPTDQTTAFLAGVDEVTASSYGSVVRPLPEVSPSKAVDAVADSAWVTAVQLDPVGQWLEIRLHEPHEVDGLRLRLLDDGPWRTPITSVQVVTDGGAVASAVAPGEAWQDVPTAGGVTSTVRVVIDAVGERPGATAAPGLREVAIDGLPIERWLVVPRPPAEGPVADAGPPSYLLQRRQANPADLLRRDEEATLQRVVTVPAATSATVQLEVTPEPGPALLELVNTTPDLQVRASSTLGDLPAFAARNLFDDDPATAWVSAGWPDDAARGQLEDPFAAPVDEVPWQERGTPSLELGWGAARTVSELRFTFVEGLSRPTSVAVEAGGTRRVAAIDDAGLATFEPVTAAALRLDFPTISRVESVDRLGAGQVRPLGISALAVDGLDGLAFPAVDGPTRLEVPCAAGPALHVEGEVRRVAVALTVRQAVEMLPVPAAVCGEAAMPLREGVARLHTVNAGGVAISSVALLAGPLADHVPPPRPAPRPPDGGGGGLVEVAAATSTARPVGGPVAPAADLGVADRPLEVRTWSDSDRSVVVGPGPEGVLVVHENANDGWQATLEGERLVPVTIAGWQQGYVLPAGSGGEVVLSFTPTTVHRVSLLVGLGLVVVVAASALVAGRASPLPAVGERRGGRLGAVLTGVAAVVVAGVAAVLLPVLWWLRRRRGVAALAGLAFLLAAGSAALRPEPGTWARDVVGPAGWLTAALALVGTFSVFANLAPGPAAPEPSGPVAGEAAGAPPGRR